MNPEELIKLLVHFSRSDKEFSSEEFAYILNVAHRLGVDQDYVENMVRHYNEPELEVPESEQSRMQIFYYLLFLMKIDRQVDQQETELIHHFGFKLGFSRAMINDFIDIIKEHKDNRIPSELMLEVIKRYQN